ncbi:hypothetical protein CLAIMM_11919 [Cladophialophora immunda]|nr:hypothetical protein CLAIMM_11919 [Cladophialophora immunda]
MDHLKEQEAGRQRMRDLFQQRELERGSLRRKRIFKTPEEEAKQAVRLTPNAQARNERELTATRGQAPVFNENIWNGERRRPAPNEIRSQQDLSQLCLNRQKEFFLNLSRCYKRPSVFLIDLLGHIPKAFVTSRRFAIPDHYAL